MTEKKKATYSSLRGIHRAVPIILIALAVFMTFCYILQDMGAVGNAISALFTGLFSWGAYIIPLLLVLHAIFYASDLDESRILSRVIFSVITMIALSSLTYAITYWNDELVFNAGEFYNLGRQSVGGGFIGSIVGFALIKAFSHVGLVIITCAVFAIYISYFFARGQRGVSAALMNILKFILIICTLAERGIKKLFGKIRNARSEKTKKTAMIKTTELTDDEFFAVDNGMEVLKIDELGIKETRSRTDTEANPTLQDKTRFKSAVSPEEAAEMERREKAEKFFTDIFEDDIPSRHKDTKRTVSFDYGDGDTPPSSSDQSETEKTQEPVFTEHSTVHDESADSVFTNDFDPFGMLADEELACKPSSRSLKDEAPTKYTVTEDISELTEEEVERAKRIREFEERKAKLVNSRRAIPVENGGEFVGTQKNIDFREQVQESHEAISEDTGFSLKVDKSSDARPAEPTPANYTSIGFGTESDSVSASITKNAFTFPETIYSHEEPDETPELIFKRAFVPENEPGNYTDYQSNGQPEPTVAEPVAPVYQAPAQSAFAQPEPTVAEPVAPVYQAPAQPAFAQSEPVAAEPVAPVYQAPAQSAFTQSEPVAAEPVAPVYQAPAQSAFAQPEPTVSEPVAPVYQAPAQSAFAQPEPVAAEPVEELPKFETSYSSSSFADDYEEETDYKPEFKPYTEPSPDASYGDSDGGDDNEEFDSESKTLTVERSIITDDDTTEMFGGSYDSFSDGDDDDGYSEENEYGDSEEYEEYSDDDSGFEAEVIPPEERNPVVQKYRDMFPALRDDDDSSFDDEEADEQQGSSLRDENDYKLISPDERDDPYEASAPTADAYEDPEESSDEPPFDDPTSDDIAAEPVKEEKKKPEKKKPDYSKYKMPPLDLLGLEEVGVDDRSEIHENTKTLIDTLASFNVTASIKGVDRGPRITRYEVVPARGVKVNAITNLFNDIALNLASEGIRMEAPIPGKSAIGFEIPNRHPRNVRLRELLECDEFQNAKSKTFVGIGKNVGGMPVFADIEKFPHALVAGATGMGKSVCINSIMISMLYKARPDEVKFIMIDPKKVEFKMYSGIPHLLIPVITDAKQAAGALMWAVEEMERRFELIEQQNVRNLSAYNEKVSLDPSIGEKLPRIIIVIDELNDLMMQVRDPVEDLIMRLAQKARAAGLHIIIGTQRPDVKVITGTIKANIPTRMSCKVSSVVDSRTILEMAGAEKLLDKGDMLFKPVDKTKPIRVQGAFVSDAEVDNIMKFLKDQVGEASYDDDVFAEIKQAAQKCGKQKANSGGFSDELEDDGQDCGYYSDQQFLDAVHLAITSKKISTSLLQRKLSIGYGKAAKYIDAMEEIGVVSEPKGQKPRDVLISMDEWHEKLSRVELD